MMTELAITMAEIDASSSISEDQLQILFDEMIQMCLWFEFCAFSSRQTSDAVALLLGATLQTCLCFLLWIILIYKHFNPLVKLHKPRVPSTFYGMIRHKFGNK